MGTTVQIINPKNYTSEAQPSKNTAPVVAEETEAQTNRRIADYNRTLDFLTFFLVLANVALWLVTWRSSVRQSRDMRAALGHAEDTAELQLRAYVFPDNINLVQRTDPLTQKNRWFIQVAWKNTGSTRTRKFVAKVSNKFFVLKDTPLETFDFVDEPDAAIFNGLIGPNQSVNQPPILITDLHLIAGGDEDMAFLIWGWCEYLDIFSSKTRRTEFSLRVRVEGNIFGNHIIHFEPTEKHNAADEDCMRPIRSA